MNATQPRKKYSPEADFRSDVVTIPEDGMMEAMKEAHMGDDVYKESGTTIDLEEHIAKMTGKEAGLFCTSGTQGNQICLRTHLYQPPYTILCDARAHIINYEAGGIAMFSQAMSTPVHPRNGRHLTLEEVQENLMLEDDEHHADTKIISLENTLNGMVFPIEEIRKISQLARRLGIAIHLDGARLWEASAATGVTMREYGDCFDSMSLCLSKGIGAPIGTVIVGSSAFIKKARFFRKMMGGGMRQTGLVSGAARYALDAHFPTALKLVHAKVAAFAEHARLKGFYLLHEADTNMVWLDLKRSGVSEQVWLVRGKKLGLTLGGARIVFHHQISQQGEDGLRRLVNSFPKRDCLNKDGTINGDAVTAEKVFEQSLITSEIHSLHI